MSKQLDARIKCHVSRYHPGRAKCIVAAANEPALGQDDEFDEWYRKQVSFVPKLCKRCVTTDT